MNDRLNPLLYIDEGNLECDICDEIGPLAIIENIGSSIGKHNIHICKKCLKEVIERFPIEHICHKCGGKLEYYFHKFWGWIFGSSYRCIKCGRKWTDKTGPR